jgi:hypothetical protein
MFRLKPTVMAFRGQVTIISNIIIDNAILEQVSTCVYLGRKISYEEEKGVI